MSLDFETVKNKNTFKKLKIEVISKLLCDETVSNSNPLRKEIPCDDKLKRYRCDGSITTVKRNIVGLSN